MLKKVKKVVINDGKVVMVELVVLDTETGVDITTVGRATCDLTEDVFNLETGIALAEERAYKKAITKFVKLHKKMCKYFADSHDRELKRVTLLEKKLK